MNQNKKSKRVYVCLFIYSYVRVYNYIYTNLVKIVLARNTASEFCELQLKIANTV